MNDLESNRFGSEVFESKAKVLSDTLYDISAKINGIDTLFSRQKSASPESKDTIYNYTSSQSGFDKGNKLDYRILALSKEAVQLLKKAKSTLNEIPNEGDSLLNPQQISAKDEMKSELCALYNQFQEQQKQLLDHQQNDSEATEKNKTTKTAVSTFASQLSEANEQTPLINSASPAADSNGNGKTYNRVTNDQTPESRLEQILDTVRQEDIDFQESLTQERELEIRGIQEGVAEINSIFKDLGVLVTQQGDGMDHIENNVTSLATNTHNASDELVKASEHQRQNRKLSLCALIFLIVLLFVVLGIVFGLK